MNLALPRLRPSVVGWVCCALVLFAFVLYRANAPPLWRVKERDRQAALREVPPPAGADERVPAVEGDVAQAADRPGVARDFIGGEGIVEPADREVKVSSHVGGRIKVVRVKEGNHVKSGDVLLELENEAEKAAWFVAERDVATQRAQLARTAAGQRPEAIQAVIGDAEAARARAALSKDALGRTEQLANGGAVTADELDRAEHQAEIDQRAYEAAEARKREAVLGARRDDVAIDAARLEASIARAAQAQAQLDQSFVRAPIDGEILQVKVRAGEYFNVNGAEPLLVMGDTRVLRVRMDVNERDVARVRVGQASFGQLPGYGSRRFPGRVVEIGRRMGRKNVRTDDPTERIDTKILEVVCELDAPSGLVPGLRLTSFLDPDPAHDRPIQTTDGNAGP